jgi:hypothetical protein
MMLEARLAPKLGNVDAMVVRSSSIQGDMSCETPPHCPHCRLTLIDNRNEAKDCLIYTSQSAVAMLLRVIS